MKASGNPQEKAQSRKCAVKILVSRYAWTSLSGHVSKIKFMYQRYNTDRPLVLSGIDGVCSGNWRRFLLGSCNDLYLGMPSNLVIGTSMFQILITTTLSALLHIISNNTVDLLFGSLF